MDLKQFVKETLLDVFDAIQEAGDIIREDPKRVGAIMPLWGGLEYASNHEQKIKFDLAVTVNKSAKGGGKGNIKVLAAFEIGGQASTESQSRAVSRVSFSVPVAMPGTVIKGSQPVADAPKRKKTS